MAEEAAPTGERAPVRTRRTARPHPVRHGRLPRSSAVRSALAAIGVTLAVAVVSASCIGAVAVAGLSREIEHNAVDISNGEPAPTPLPVPHIGAVEGGFNFLMVGTDNDKDQGDAFGERDGAVLNDVNILLHVAADHRSAVVVSIPRDLVVAHPRCEDPENGDTYGAMSARPMNEAFSRGGLGCVVATVSQLTGFDIPYAGTVSFNGVIAMTDALGGVPVCVDEPITDPWSGLDLAAGTTVVSGGTALAFLRARHSVGEGGDLSRISLQQSYMASLMRTMKSADTLANPATLYGLARAAATNIKLSSNLASLDAMVALAYALKDVDLDRLVFVQYPGSTGSTLYPGKVEPNTYLAELLFEKIAADLPFSLDENALGLGTDADPNSAPAPEAPATDPSAPSTEAPPAETAVEPEVIGGLKGQTAGQQTCAAAYRF